MSNEYVPLQYNTAIAPFYDKFDDDIDDEDIDVHYESENENMDDNFIDDENDIDMQIELKALKYELSTGLSNLKPAFILQSRYPTEMSDIDALVHYLSEKYNENNYNISVYEYIKDIVKFSKKFLKFLGADQPSFYHNLLPREAIFILLTKAFDTYKLIPSHNGFPSEFNFRRGQGNQLHNTEYNIP